MADFRKKLKRVETSKNKATSSDPFDNLQRFQTLMLSDGSRISVQGGFHWYSDPQENHDSGIFYSTFEVSKVTRFPEWFANYADDKGPLGINTIFSNVPYLVIQGYIDAAGGIMGAITFKK